jgi:AraC-like DNA-binding protein
VPYAAWDRLPDIVTMGDRIFEPHWATTPHASGHCELLFVIEGRVRTVLGRGRGFVTEPGGIVLIPRDARHRDVFDLDRGLRVFLVFFRWAHDRDYFALVPPSAVHRMASDVRSQVDRLVGRLRRLIESGTEADRLLARSHLLTILLLILHGHVSAGRRAARPRVAAGRHRHALMQRAREYLDAHYAEEISLERVAESLQVSPFYLSHAFSQEHDFSLMEYLTDRRMRQASQLLQSGTRNVSEAARAVGYKDGNYFAKVFRRHFGFAPSELRGAPPAPPQKKASNRDSVCK